MVVWGSVGGSGPRYRRLGCSNLGEEEGSRVRERGATEVRDMRSDAIRVGVWRGREL